MHNTGSKKSGKKKAGPREGKEDAGLGEEVVDKMRGCFVHKSSQHDNFHATLPGPGMGQSIRQHPSIPLTFYYQERMDILCKLATDSTELLPPPLSLAYPLDTAILLFYELLLLSR